MKKTLLKFYKDYFNFTRGERNAFLILVILTLICSVYPLLDISASDKRQTDFSQLIALAEQRKDTMSGEDLPERLGEYPEKHISSQTARFAFDPNTASVSALESLGFKTYIARRIEKYRSSGGKFRVKADLKKVYGIDQELVDLLWHDIRLPESLSEKTAEIQQASSYIQPPKALIELNTADTSALIALPGIGSKLARRIVEFRTKLGGFYSLEQLREVYGLKPETIDQLLPLLKLDVSGIAYLNVNTADIKALDAHPYINRNQANAIVSYRNQHGQYKSLEELAKIVVFDEVELNKIKSYIKF